MLSIKQFQKRIFYNFVKASFYPSAITCGLKVFYFLLLSTIYDVSFVRTPIGVIYNNFDNFVFVNTLSNVLTFATLFVGLCYLLFKAFFLHDIHISPRLSAFLYAQNLQKFVTSSLTLYVNLFSWLLFNYLMVFLILFQAILFYESYMTFFVTFFLTLFATVLVIVDLEKDHEILKVLKEYV